METDLRAESRTVKKGARGGWRAVDRALGQLTCRPLRAPPRRFARPFPRPRRQFGRSGLSDCGLKLRLRSRPGSGTGTPGSGVRGSGGGPGAATASSPSADFSSASPQPIILEWLQGYGVTGDQGSQGTGLTPLLPGPSQALLRKPLAPTQGLGETSPRPALLTLPSVISVAPLPVSWRASAARPLGPTPRLGF